MSEKKNKNLIGYSSYFFQKNMFYLFFRQTCEMKFMNSEIEINLKYSYPKLQIIPLNNY